MEFHPDPPPGHPDPPPEQAPAAPIGLILTGLFISWLATPLDQPETIVAGASKYGFFGDEHGKLVVDAAQRPPLGARVEFVTPHCDPTVNLYDRYHVVDGDMLVDIWLIEARGRL